VGPKGQSADYPPRLRVPPAMKLVLAGVLIRYCHAQAAWREGSKSRFSFGNEDDKLATMPGTSLGYIPWG